jgi:RNA polymerase sigma-70 factor (ECF subfamily)
MMEDTFECGLVSRTETFDEDQVLVAAVPGDPAAAAKLYDKYYRPILGYIYHCTLDRDVTEDLTANVFLAVFRHLGRYRWRQLAFRAWLYRIATNEVRTYYRRQRRAHVSRLDAQRSLGVEDSAGIPPAAPPAGERPATAEEYGLLHQALQQLRPKYRTAIILRYFEDKTTAEISEITGQREGTIRSQLHRGLAQLQDLLGRWGVLPESSGTPL